MRKYRLLPQFQRKADGSDRVYPISGVVFSGSSVVETGVDLRMWVGVLVSHVDVDDPSGDPSASPVAVDAKESVPTVDVAPDAELMVDSAPADTDPEIVDVEAHADDVDDFSSLPDEVGAPGDVDSDEPKKRSRRSRRAKS